MGVRRTYLQARARQRVAARVDRVLLGPVSSTVADTGARTIEEHLWDPRLRAHVLDQVQLVPPAIATYPFAPDLPAPFRRSKAFDARNLYRLQKVLVSPHTGLVWTPEGRVLEESVGALRRIVGWGDMLHEPLMRAQPLGSAHPVVCCPPTNFYHWLTEAVPGLLAARELEPEVRLLLPARSPRYVEDLLELLGIGPDQVVRSEGTMRVAELLLPAVDPFSGFVHPDTIERLRRTFTALLEDPGPRASFYVSRRRAPRRRMRGEEALEARLTEHGLDVVFAEDLSLAEQVRLFARAETVVAPHGAGLTNLLWIPPGGRLVEIFPADDFNDCYARLAVAGGWSYAPVTAEPDADSSGVIPVDAVNKALGDVART